MNNIMTDKELIYRLAALTGWRQDRIARELGYSGQPRISDILTGRQKMSGPARRLAEKLIQEKSK